MTTLPYPLDLSDKYYLSLSFAAYTRPDPYSSTISLPAVNGTSSINLPLPAKLVDALNLKWDATSIASDPYSLAAEGVFDLAAGNNNSAEAAATTAGIALAPQIIGGILVGGASAAKSGATGTPISGALFNKLEQGASSAISAATRNALQRMGQAINPVLTMQFSNPEFKQHQFSWRFAPNNSTETGRLREVIETIKYNSKPNSLFNGAFFGYPSIVTVKIITGATELYKILPCVITNVTADYAPMNVPSFFAGTSGPTEVQLDISLVEIILNTRNNSTLEGFDTPEDLGITLSNPTGALSSITNAFGAVTSIIKGL